MYGPFYTFLFPRLLVLFLQWSIPVGKAQIPAKKRRIVALVFPRLLTQAIQRFQVVIIEFDGLQIRFQS
jgi:ubiquitin C-terminal hydrolase